MSRDPVNMLWNRANISWDPRNMSWNTANIIWNTGLFRIKKTTQRLDPWPPWRKVGFTLPAPGVIFSPTDTVIPARVWASQACLTPRSR